MWAQCYLISFFFFERDNSPKWFFNGKLGDLFFKCYFSGSIKSAYGSSTAVSGVNL